MALNKLNAWKVITGAASFSAQVVIQETSDDIESLEACDINLVVGYLANPHWRSQFLGPGGNLRNSRSLKAWGLADSLGNLVVGYLVNPHWRTWPVPLMLWVT
jgi:hypothetical protein